MDTDSIWYKRNKFWGKQLRKARANAQLGELHLQEVKEPNRIPHIISSGTYKVELKLLDRHVGEQVHNPIEDIRNSAFGERELCDHERCRVFAGFVTGHCSICNSMLTRLFPRDYPNEWKFCCSCKCMAEEIVKGTLPDDFWINERSHKVLKKITLVGK